MKNQLHDGQIAKFVPDSGEIGQTRSIFQVDEGHRSQYTAEKYRVDFKHFLNFVGIHDLQVLLDQGKEVLQAMVINYAKSLRDNPVKKYSRSTVNNRIVAVLYFLDNNDIELNKRKIRRYFPSDESIKDDRPYTHEEIERILSVCNLRTKAMILLMASSAVRIGALSNMQIGDLTPVKYANTNLFRIHVYARTREKFYTFCTPECAKAIDEYLDYRKRCGEEIKDKSPLFRKHFNKDDPFTINIPHFLTDDAVMKSIDGVLKQSGIKTSEVMRSHSFRKGFKSICEQSGMKSINVETLMGHDIGVSGHYYRPAESDILEDYMKAVDALTISEENRLKKQIKHMELRHSEEWNQLKVQMNELKELLNLKSE